MTLRLNPYLYNKKAMQRLLDPSSPYRFCNLHDPALASPSRLIWVLRLLHFGNHLLKRLRHVSIEPRTGLCKAAIEFFGQLPSLFSRNVPLIWSQITFVPDNHQWHPVSSLPFD